MFLKCVFAQLCFVRVVHLEKFIVTSSIKVPYYIDHLVASMYA